MCNGRELGLQSGRLVNLVRCFSAPNKELHLVFATLNEVLDEHLEGCPIGGDARGQNSGAWNGAMLNPILGITKGIMVYVSQLSGVQTSLEGLGSLHDP